MNVKTFYSALFIVAVLTCFSLNSIAQSSKSGPRSKAQNKSVTLELPSIPVIVDFAYVVRIDKSSNITVSIQRDIDQPLFTNTSSLATLSNLFSSLPKAAAKPKVRADPIVVIKADASLRYEQVFNTIKSIRDKSDLKIRISISDSLDLFVQPKIVNYEKPNPLMLLVSIDENGNLDLNGDSMGKLKQSSVLRERLFPIFKDRAENGVFRPGTNEAETTVYLNPSPSIMFAEVIDLAEEIKKSGSTLVGLQVDSSGLPMRKQLTPVYEGAAKPRYETIS